VTEMREVSSMLGDVTTILTGLLAAIAGISVLVGGIGIMNNMLVSVTERTREIGVRLAVGARESQILTQFLVEAVALSMLGGVIGIGFGLGAAAIAAPLLGVHLLSATGPSSWHLASPQPWRSRSVTFPPGEPPASIPSTLCDTTSGAIHELPR